ncbi:hypothetical protein ACFQV2_24645 [Actinokineospora soli]|uniref:Uncharacterized protein n=1 Tax=Actinokineospora soli TaxID=1048753 RepID=A0ABW2TSR7_9PSEU
MKDGVVVCFARLPNLARTETRVNRWTAALLGLCDGTRTIAEIGASLPAPEREVNAVLGRLRRVGLVSA